VTEVIGASDGPQAMVLRSVLAGAPLPGGSGPVRLADLHLAVEETAVGSLVRLTEEGLEADAAALAEASAASGAGTPARLVGPGELAGLDPGGDTVVGVLRVSTEEGTGTATVTAAVCGVRHGELLPLESVRVAFEQRAGRWVVAGPPAHLAT
jgi:hypothetical protein